MSETSESSSRQYQVLRTNHVFINLCDNFNYVVANPDIRQCICNAFRLECSNLP